MRLKDRTAIVTGGAAGIGKAIAAAFVAEGARVAILDLDADKAQQVAAEIASDGQAFGIACDVGFSESVNQAFDEAERRLGGLDILVSNAGVIGKSTIVEMPEEDWDFLIRNNLKSVFLCTQQAARRMIARGVGGRIIAISSIHAVLSEPYCGHYTAAKSGVEGLCRTLASELAEHKITVNFIRPGATYTNLTSPIYTERVKRALYERIPLKEIASPEWIACGAVFLASDDARYMTGQPLTIDGGYLMDGSLPGARYWDD